MQELDEGIRAFSTFSVLNGNADIVERDQLFRNMAQLFSYVSDRCDDEQVAQYDEVLCQLADLVEIEARAHVARLLAPLARVPGMVVVKLANDVIEVARPLLEFSNVLSDDDLIDIIAERTEAHRIAIAGRIPLTTRVGDALAQFGESASVSRLVRNEKAELSETTIEKLVTRAIDDANLAADLRGRVDVDWASVRGEITTVAGKVLETLGRVDRRVDSGTAGKVNAVVYNRMRNRAGFSSQEWKLAYNQVKALSDRRGLNEMALARFARFGYGHHAAAGLSMLLRVSPEVFVKWLAMQEYVALTVASRALGLSPELFNSIIAILPWRDLPTEADKTNVGARFEAITQEEASEIFETWRAHSFRRRSAIDEPAAGNA
jgi:hypothetical protein